MVDACPFCSRIAAGEVAARVGTAVAFPDAFPVADGHTLVVPVTHLADLLALNPDELRDLWTLALTIARELRNAGADGVNIGANVGAAAGQTVAHAHLHVIPRRAGDAADPRGGIRWVLPDRAAYWNRPRD